MNARSTWMRLIWAGAVVVWLGWAAQPVAEEPFATSQDASAVSQFLGVWAVTMDINGQTINFDLRLVDLNGKAGGTIDSPQMPEPRALDSIGVDDRGNLIIGYEMSFGSQSFNMQIEASLSAEGLEGTIVESSGLFSAEFTAVESLVDLETQGQRQRIRRAAANMVRLRIGDDKLRVSFSPLKSDSEDYKRLSDVKAAEVFKFVGGRATKMFTDLDLQFPDALVKTENAAPNYPGVYSLWLKKTRDGWNLVFNEEADIWGTMYNPEADAVEIALRSGTAEEPSATFKVELEQTGAGGQIRLLWGDHLWTADFAIEAVASQTASSSD